MKNKLLVVSLLAGIASVAGAVEEEEWEWIEAKDFGVEGQPFADSVCPYGRLPRGWKGAVSGLGRHSVGLTLGFTVDDICVRLKAELEPGVWAGVKNDLYMTPFAQVGFDWYWFDAKRNAWIYGDHGWPSGKDGSTDAKIWTAPGEPKLVNFPIRATLKSVKIGVRKGHKLSHLAPHKLAKKPVVHYGTSIVHGGCVSRPGLGFTAQASRLIDVEWINLGFSGSAQMEREICTNLLARVDASLYIIDPLWNMDMKLLKERYEPFVRELRRLRPTTPILLCEDSQISRRETEKGLYVRAVYEKLKSEGWTDLHLLKTAEQLPPDGDLTLDGCHPNDAGAAVMARAYAAKVKSILAPGK